VECHSDYDDDQELVTGVEHMTRYVALIVIWNAASGWRDWM